MGFSIVAGPLRGGSTGGRWELSASVLSAAVQARNRLFLLYPKRPGREPGLLQRSSGAQVRWMPCGARTPATFETSRISCVVALSQSWAYSTVPAMLSVKSAHMWDGFFYLFIFFPWALHSGSVGGSPSSLSSSLLGNLWLGVLGSHSIFLDPLHPQ